MSFFSFYLFLLWAHSCGPQDGLLKQGAECWNQHFEPVEWGLSKTDSRSSLDLNPKERDESQGILHVVCLSCTLAIHTVTLMTVRWCYHQCFGFTPQNWVFLHVIRHHLAGVQVAVEQFTSLLDKKNAQWESESVLYQPPRDFFFYINVVARKIFHTNI